MSILEKYFYTMEQLLEMKKSEEKVIRDLEDMIRKNVKGTFSNMNQVHESLQFSLFELEDIMSMIDEQS